VPERLELEIENALGRGTVMLGRSALARQRMHCAHTSTRRAATDSCCICPHKRTCSNEEVHIERATIDY
jgi:hypothetical protein